MWPAVDLNMKHNYIRCNIKMCIYCLSNSYFYKIIIWFQIQCKSYCFYSGTDIPAGLQALTWGMNGVYFWCCSRWKKTHLPVDAKIDRSPNANPSIQLKFVQFNMVFSVTIRSKYGASHMYLRQDTLSSIWPEALFVSQLSTTGSGWQLGLT